MNYTYIEKKYGEMIAINILIDLERHAHLNSAMLAAVDRNIRFEAAVATNNYLSEQAVAVGHH